MKATFDGRVDRIRWYWSGVFNRGPMFDSCVVVSVLLLSLVYLVGLVWMIPFSVAKAFK